MKQNTKGNKVKAVNLTVGQFNKVIKEEVSRQLKRAKLFENMEEEPMEEGWKDAAVGAAMTVSSMFGGLNAQVPTLTRSVQPQEIFQVKGYTKDEVTIKRVDGRKLTVDVATDVKGNAPDETKTRVAHLTEPFKYLTPSGLQKNDKQIVNITSKYGSQIGDVQQKVMLSVPYGVKVQFENGEIVEKKNAPKKNMLKEADGEPVEWQGGKGSYSAMIPSTGEEFVITGFDQSKVKVSRSKVSRIQVEYSMIINKMLGNSESQSDNIKEVIAKNLRPTLTSTGVTRNSDKLVKVYQMTKERGIDVEQKDIQEMLKIILPENVELKFNR